MEHLRSLDRLVENLQGPKIHGKNLADEMKELEKLRTAIMVEKCISRNEVVVCPKPRKRNIRQVGEHNDLKVVADLSDILISKASPPYFSGSPPIRASNPLSQDAHFCEQRTSQLPALSVRPKHLDGVNCNRTIRSILTMA